MSVAVEVIVPMSVAALVSGNDVVDVIDAVDEPPTAMAGVLRNYTSRRSAR